MKKLLIVLNPLAGQKKGKKYLADIIGMFCEAGYECTVRYTMKRYDAKKIVAESANLYERIIVIGGDGTLNEAVSGMLEVGGKAQIGYIPAGSTNDFASSLKLPKNVLKATQRIINGKENNIDVGVFNGRYFSYVASFGAFTKTSYATSQSVKNSLGHLAYILEGVKELTNIHREHLKFEIDGEVFEDDYIFGAISNSTSVGGILKLDPNIVDLNDGLLEIILVRSPRNLVELNDCITALSTKRYNSKMITFKSAKSLTVYSDGSTEWTLDGEHQKGAKMIEISNLNSAIKLIF